MKKPESLLHKELEHNFLTLLLEIARRKGNGTIPESVEEQGE